MTAHSILDSATWRRFQYSNPRRRGRSAGDLQTGSVYLASFPPSQFSSSSSLAEESLRYLKAAILHSNTSAACKLYRMKLLLIIRNRLEFRMTNPRTHEPRILDRSSEAHERKLASTRSKTRTTLHLDPAVFCISLTIGLKPPCIFLA